MPKVRPEIFTRTAFAQKKAKEYFKKMYHNNEQGGNLLSCNVTQKFCQAKRIYDHYSKEFGLLMYPEIYAGNQKLTAIEILMRVIPDGCINLRSYAEEKQMIIKAMEIYGTK